MNRDKPVSQTVASRANGSRVDHVAKAEGAAGRATLTHAPREEIRVEIFVADHCAVCEYAFEVADSIRADFPSVELDIINLSQTTEDIPEAVFATPTYLLNGRLWSLGNPSPTDVQERLSLALADRSTTKTQNTAGDNR